MKNNPNDIRYIDLRIDYAFKHVFGREGCEENLRELLNCILPEKHIRKVILGPQEQTGDRPDSKRAIYDIFCTTDSGEMVTVEMQLLEQSWMGDRMLYYSSYPIRTQMRRGDGDYHLSPVCIIGILDFVMPGVKTNEKVINRFSIRSDTDKDVLLTDSVEFVTVELPKMSKKIDELANDTEILLYLLRNLGSMKSVPDCIKRNEIIKDIVSMAEYSAMTEKEQWQYMRELMAEVDDRARYNCALKKGLNQGLSEGLEQGLEQGASSARMDTARNLKRLGVSVDIICQATGIERSVVEGL